MIRIWPRRKPKNLWRRIIRTPKESCEFDVNQGNNELGFLIGGGGDLRQLARRAGRGAVVVVRFRCAYSLTSYILNKYIQPLLLLRRCHHFFLQAVVDAAAALSNHAAAAPVPAAVDPSFCNR
ncbi:hypothetical protein L1887_03480 [Cichorium endivia]|nr:hypothetical protein L1887_03480 [Cichorium endivia]